MQTLSWRRLKMFKNSTNFSQKAVIDIQSTLSNTVALGRVNRQRKAPWSKMSSIASANPIYLALTIMMTKVSCLVKRPKKVVRLSKLIGHQLLCRRRNSQLIILHAIKTMLTYKSSIKRSNRVSHLNSTPKLSFR